MGEKQETTIQTEVNTRMIVFCDIFVSNSKKNRKQVNEQKKIMKKKLLIWLERNVN